MGIAKKLEAVDRRFDRKVDRVFDCASFPTPAVEAVLAKLEAERKLEKARILAPRLVKKESR